MTCKTCGGSGTLNDAGLGDIYYNTWACPDCPVVYVVGYCFDLGMDFVALIEKLKPAWQAEKLNGIGGKVEVGEEPRVAMAREFKEEAGAFIPHQSWLHVRTEQWSLKQEAKRGLTRAATIHHFAARCTDAGQWARVRTMERERIVKVRYPLSPSTMRRIIHNIEYLVPMAAVHLRNPPENRAAP